MNFQELFFTGEITGQRDPSTEAETEAGCPDSGIGRAQLVSFSGVELTLKFTLSQLLEPW